MVLCDTLFHARKPTLSASGRESAVDPKAETTEENEDRKQLHYNSNAIVEGLSLPIHPGIPACIDGLYA